MPRAEGKEFKFDTIDKIRPDYLETFDFDSKDQYIITKTKEFSAVCPFSGLPDLAKIIIEYYPDGGKCVELKSLKYYFISFRNVGIYQEAVTQKIYSDLNTICEKQVDKTHNEFNKTINEFKLLLKTIRKESKKQ